MVVFDMSALVFTVAQDYCNKTKEELTADILRHLVLNRIQGLRSNLQQYTKDGTVLAFDSRHYWRRDIFPNYKASRKAARKASNFDWPAFFMLWDIVREELKEVLPFYCIELYGAEADDIIASICFRYNHKQIVIVSSDEDFLQLQSFPNVKQYSLKRKDFITPEGSGYSLFEHIIKGDTGDGIPNILSGIDDLVNGVRQKPLTTKKIAEWRPHGIRNAHEFCTTDMHDRLHQNKKLIDLSEIPDEMVFKVEEMIDNYKMPKGKLFNYFFKHKLLKMMDTFKV